MIRNLLTWRRKKFELWIQKMKVTANLFNMPLKNYEEIQLYPV